jgi:nitrite reductase/ring-hydroxylating ferredoxin subunit
VKRFYPLEKLINLQDNYVRTFKIDQHQLLLIQTEGEPHLIEGLCPHRGHPLDTAAIAQRRLECPLHKYQFSLEDGALIHSTEEPCRGLRKYAVVYEGNEIGVMLEE